MLLWVIDAISNFSAYKHNFFYSVLFRGLSSFLLAFFVFLSIGRYIINQLHNFCIFQIIRFNGPKSHLLKQDIPTMGGIIVLLSVTISVVILGDLSNIHVWLALFTFFAYGLLGLIDDLYKVKRKKTNGLSISCKFFWQSLIALILIIGILLSKNNNLDTISWSFLLKKLIFQLDFWSIILAYFVFVGTSNAVNLSDGLDGLAIGPVILILLGLSALTWVSSSLFYSNRLHILYIANIRELIIVCAAIIGAGLGFLWFNAYPAQIFMGDTGALACGGVIGLITILLHQEFLLLIMGGTLVLESISVILQVICFKFFKKRIFKMAPIHHHFELKGYPEPKIVIRFWIISSILVCCSLIIFIVKK